MLRNFSYRLPIVKSTYKSNYGKGRDDIIGHDVEYFDLKHYSLEMINKSIEAYDEVINRLHKVSFSCLINLQEKSQKFKEIILEELNLIVEDRFLNEVDIVTIEYYFKDRKEKLEIIRESKSFEQEMILLANEAKKQKWKKNKKKNQSSSNNSDISTFSAEAILTTVGIENV